MGLGIDLIAITSRDNITSVDVHCNVLLINIRIVQLFDNLL